MRASFARLARDNTEIMKRVKPFGLLRVTVLCAAQGCEHLFIPSASLNIEEKKTRTGRRIILFFFTLEPLLQNKEKWITFRC